VDELYTEFVSDLSDEKKVIVIIIIIIIIIKMKELEGT
jgi:hypothetical protein